MLLQINNGAVSFGAETILTNIDFQINKGEKIAIVGRNGCGKSTLLKLISGEVELSKRDSDEDIFIAKSGNPKIGYLKQMDFNDVEITLDKEIEKVFMPLIKMEQEINALLEKINNNKDSNDIEKDIKRYTALREKFENNQGYYYKKEYEIMIKKFGFSKEDKNKKLKEFSGGQLTKIALIKLLLSKPDLILLDEPTNHLDIDTIMWLENYLKNYQGAVIIVSHDRMFLDKIVGIVYEIEYKTAKRYIGNYSDFVERRRLNYEKQLKDYELQQKEIKRLTQLVESFKNHPTKASMARSKLKQIEHMVKIAPPDRYDLKSFKASFKPKEESGKEVLSVHDLQIGYDKVISTVSLNVKKGEKVGIIGGNGLGKSTFLRTLVRDIKPMGGEFQYGLRVDTGYFEQQMAKINSDKTVIDEFWDKYKTLKEVEVRNALGAFLFTQEDVYKKVNMLSGGEKVRLVLCMILKTRPNFLILDEPTNHMDIVGKETLENMIKNFEGSVLVVSHDRYFIKKVADSLLVFEEGKVTYYPYGYEEYIEKINAEVINEEKKSEIKNDISNNKKDYLDRKEKAKNERKAKKIEDEISKIELEIETLKNEINDESNSSDYVKLQEIYNEIARKEEEVMELMQKWEEIDRIIIC